MIEEQMKFEQEKQKLKKREDKRLKEEQKKILGKGNARPKLSFSLGASQHFGYWVGGHASTFDADTPPYPILYSYQLPPNPSFIFYQNL